MAFRTHVSPSRRLVALAGAALLLASCADGDGGGSDDGGRPASATSGQPGDARPRVPAGRVLPRKDRAPAFALRRIGTFDAPVLVTQPPGARELAVVEKTGRVLLVRGARQRTLVDLRGMVSLGSEQGLLGLAFHPRYRDNRRLFVNYTDARGDTRVVEYRAQGDGQARRHAELLTVDQPYANHNGGHLLFGRDGYLYVGLGDGGSAGDPKGNGQDPSSLLGKLLRIDVDRGTPYAIPPDNPWKGRRGPDNGRDEVWAYGLRNPWRFSFDRLTGDLYIADVGQNEWEEIHVEPAGAPGGRNYGWNAREGFERFRGGDRPHSRPIDPVYAYSHEDGCSITGGHVYRGRAVPALRGWYLFADYCRDWVRAMPVTLPPTRRRRDSAIVQLDGVAGISSFGEDSRGELYVTALDGGVYRVVAGG